LGENWGEAEAGPALLSLHCLILNSEFKCKCTARKDRDGLNRNSKELFFFLKATQRHFNKAPVGMPDDRDNKKKCSIFCLRFSYLVKKLIY